MGAIFQPKIFEMDALYFSYFARNFGEAYENEQIELGLNSLGQVRSFVQIIHNYESGCSVDTSLEGFQAFKANMQRDTEFYRRSSEREFISAALAAPEIERPYFE